MTDNGNSTAGDLQLVIDAGFAGTPAAIGPAAGFQPLGVDSDCPGCDPAEIPQSLSDLGELLSYTYDMTVRRAGELNIPVVGGVSGGFDRRVVVYEWTRYKELSGTNGIKCRYGYVIRFCLTVSHWDVKAKVSLPFLSAQAELGNIQASWLMQVRGLSGPKIDAQILPPQELKVETFVIARRSLADVIGAVSDQSTKFHPGIVTARVDPNSPEVAYWQAVVRAFAVDSVRRGRKRADAQARLGSTDAGDADVIGEVYEFFGVPDPTAEPGAGARENALRLLRGVRVDK
jgi:hypothetical protein